MRSMPLGEGGHSRPGPEKRLKQQRPQVCPEIAFGFLSSFIAAGTVLQSQTSLHHRVPLGLCPWVFPLSASAFLRQNMGAGR